MNGSAGLVGRVGFHGFLPTLSICHIGWVTGGSGDAVMLWRVVWVGLSKGDGHGANIGSIDGDAIGKGLGNVSVIGKGIGEVFGLLGNDVCGPLGKRMVSGGV